MKFLLTLVLTVFSLGAFSAVNITSDKSSGCPPLVVNFGEQSTASFTSWTWDFGNGNSSNDSAPSAEFLNSGVYNIKLIVSNGTVSDTVFKTITVFKLPVVNFTVSTPNSCTIDTVFFNSNVTLGSAPIVRYAWGFGNGVASSDSAPFYIYNTPGSYNITLVVQDSNGCTANLSRPSSIHIYTPPVAAFSASPTSSCQIKQLVNFTNQSTGNAITYFWQLGNNLTSTATNPSDLYPTGSFTATLTVTDSIGCQSTASQGISVGPIVADFTVSKTKACTGEQLNFINNSTNAGSSWLWDFGDGTTSSSSSPTKIYQAPGTYTVSFVVSSPGCADSLTKVNYITIKKGFSVPSATFTADSTLSCGQPLNVDFTNTTPTDPTDTYHWVFGNGDTSNQQNPGTLYTTPGNYTVTLIITDTNGCMISGTKTDYIRTAKPAANFIAPTSICLGSTVSFTNTSTNASVYMWLFGDGDTSYSASPSHVYADTGSYSVTLFAYSEGGCDSIITKPNCVRVSYVNVNFEVNSTFSPCPPFVCLFTNKSDIKVNKFVWSFGDGYTDTATNPTHIYFYPGIYTIKLFGQTAQGCYDTAVYKDLITVQGPTGSFNLTPTTGCAPLAVNITATTSANTQTVWCDMGDGSVTNDTLVLSHVYQQPRIYHPQFVLTDHVGCTVSYPLDSITVYPAPTLTTSDTTVCPGSQVMLKAISNATQLTWYPDTLLSCSACANVFLTPTDSMTYQVVATNAYGCQTGAEVNVNVVPLPVLNDSISARLCTGDTRSLFVGNASSIVWSPGLYLSDSTIANPVCSPMDSVTYTVTAANSIGCKVSTQVPIIVQKKVDVSLPSNATVCIDGSVNLPVKAIFISDLGAKYLWNNAQYLNDPYSSDPLATMRNKEVAFRVVVTSGHCIPDTQTVNVLVVDIPDLEVSSTIMTTPGAAVPLYAASHQQLTYQWTAKDSFSCADCRRTTLYPTQSQTVYVEGTDGSGCIARDSVQIDIEGCDPGSIFLPNTFTPNGDGLNDKLYVRTVALASLKYFRVYDEWGQMVFETKDLQEGWDGNVKEKQGSTAVYVYVLEGTCQNGYDVRKTGNVTAIR